MTPRSVWENISTRSGLPDLVKALSAVIEILTVGCDTKYKDRLYRWAASLHGRVSNIGGSLGQRMRYLKDYFALCRRLAISGRFSAWEGNPQVPFRRSSSTIERRQTLHQVSRLSRALREADDQVAFESLEAHWNLAGSAYETPQELLESFRSFVRDRFCGDMRGSLGSVKPSSSFSRTRGLGGAPEEIREITDAFRLSMLSHVDLERLLRSAYHLFPDGIKLINTEFLFDSDPVKGAGRRVQGLLAKQPAEVLLFPYDRESEMSLEDWEVQREHYFACLACWQHVSHMDVLRCRQVAVKERGWKCRVVTPLDAPLRYILGVINTALLESLERCPESVSALHGRPAEKIDWSRGRRTNLVFSADLKSATDYLPHDLVKVAAEELSKGWPKPWVDLFIKAVGPHEMTSFDGSQTQLTQRGILMGSPVSWPLLSMYSVWLHELSGSDGWFSVCGDDYIGCHTYSSYRRYLRMRAATGAIGSPGKDILGKQSVGVFAEELVSVGRCRWIPTCSVRAVLADPKSGQPDWSQGPEVGDALDVLNWTSIEKGRVCARLHKRAYASLRRVGIDPVGPRWIGCAGFPGVPTHQTLLRARRLVSQSEEIVAEWLVSLEAVWQPLSQLDLIKERILREMESARGEFLNRVHTAEIGYWGPMRDVIAQRMGQLTWGYFLAGAVKHQQRVSLGRISKAIKRVCAEIADRGRWLPPDSEVVSGEGIVRRLNDLEPKCRYIPSRTYTMGFDLKFEDRGFPRITKRPVGPGTPDWGPRKRRRLF